MVQQFFNLQNKTAIVVGMSNSVAKDVSLALAEFGANVVAVCSAVNEVELKNLSETEALVKSQGRQSLAISEAADSEEKVSNIVNKVLITYKGIDIFINNLDLPLAKPLLDNSFQEWEKVIDLNLNRFFIWSKLIGRVMVKQNKGRIISITSHLGNRGLNNCVAYCAAKGGVIQMTKALSLEWAKNGITVNAVALGWMEDSQLTAKMDPSFFEPITKYLPIRRLGKTDEVGGIVLYLSSDEAEFISGNVFNVDGGVACHP
ncbi:MAG: SDR family oxidoreductase [Candidatus Tectomicrobia bacterium]|uniref:SDR family oxidoreductase n=1 Tax=Tectimicrobiota bacterium TaxID=2528274 RepID=A0A933GKM5_UNCTE|nr:SDR family oxidoreductase [Candidatus Tectomicrobia bacterium]